MADLQLTIGTTGAQQAAADVGKLNQAIKTTGDTTDKHSLSAMQNFRMTNQMGSAFQGAAMQLSGMNGFGQQAFMMLDNLGDTIERTKLQGGGMKDVFAGLKNEMGMIASAGVIAAVAYGFKMLTDMAKENLAMMDHANSTYDKIDTMRAQAKLEALNKAFKDGTVDADTYEKKFVSLSVSIATAQDKANFDKIEARFKDAQTRMAVLTAQGESLATNGAMQIWVAFQQWKERQTLEGAQKDYEAQLKFREEQEKIFEGQAEDNRVAAEAAKEEKITAKRDEEQKKRLALQQTNDQLEINQMMLMETSRLKAAQREATSRAAWDKIITANHKAYLTKQQQDEAANNAAIIADVIRIENLKRLTAWQTANSLSILAQAIYESTGSRNKAMLAATKALAVADVGVQSIRAIWKAYGDMGPLLGSIAAAGIAGKAVLDIGRITAAGTGGGVPEVANVAIAQPTFATADAVTPATGGTGGTGGGGTANMATTNSIAQVNFTQTIMIQGNVIAGDFMRMLKEYTEMGIRAGGGRLATT